MVSGFRGKGLGGGEGLNFIHKFNDTLVLVWQTGVIEFMSCSGFYLVHSNLTPPFEGVRFFQISSFDEFGVHDCTIC